MSDGERTPGDEPLDEARSQWRAPSEALSSFDPGHGELPAPESVSSPHLIRFGFRVGAMGLLVEEGKTAEVVQEAAVYPVPNTALWLSGLINVRGNLVPVYDLRVLFTIERAQAKQHLLVIDRGETAAAFIVDTLPRSVKLGENLSYVPPVPALLRDHVSKVFLVEGEMWLDFTLESFLDSLATKVAI